MIHCPICQWKNEDDSRFCAECGQRLNAPSKPEQQPQPASVQTAAEASRQATPRLHSPLLSNAGSDSAPQSAAPWNAADSTDAGGEVGRLRQMSSRQVEKPVAQSPELPFKNPFDPRNDPRNAQAQQPISTDASSHAGEEHAAPKAKLRSPLLAGDDFDDDDDYQNTAPQQQQSRGGFRSPLLGNSDSGGGGSRRSSLLGGGGVAPQSDYQDYDSQGASGGGLRSPLLGGGYAGAERRQNIQDQDYAGPERRKGGLRSPMLSGGDEEYYDDYEDDVPVEDDNPNVLRSPLLAARRPVQDKSNIKYPQGSNAGAQPQQNQPSASPQQGNQPAPDSSFSSLKNIAPSTQADLRGAVPPAPQPVAEPIVTLPPTAPTPPVTEQSTPPAAPQTPTQPGYQFGLPQSTSPQAQQQSLQAPWASGSVNERSLSLNSPAAESSTTGLPGSASSSNLQPHVQPPTVSKQMTSTATPSGKLSNDAEFEHQEGLKSPFDSGSHPETRDQSHGRGRSKLISSVTDDYEDDPASTYDIPRGKHLPQAAASGSPVAAMIGGFAVLLLLGKAWAFFSGFLASDWSKIGWLVTDQIVSMLTLVCLIVLCFTQKSHR